MDKLEHFLDQVCRGIAGPRSLRQHIRRELREHLIDAAAEHRENGMTDPQAMEKALEDFGGPEQVRAELAATHGHRAMAVVIDKAMQWKERTMRAKFLWSAWAHAALLLVIAAEALFVTSSLIFVMPKVREIVREAGLGLDQIFRGAQTMFDLLVLIANGAGWVILGVIILWALFEWRVRSENKTMIRLSALGTVALLLSVLVFMSGALCSIPLAVAAPALMNRPPEASVKAQLSRLQESLTSLDQALAAKDWNAMIIQSNRAEIAARRLAQLGAAAPVIILDATEQQPKVAALRQQLSSCQEILISIRAAAIDKDAQRVNAGLEQLRETPLPVLMATTTPSPGAPARSPVTQPR